MLQTRQTASEKRNTFFTPFFPHLMSYLHISTALFPFFSEVQANPERTAPKNPKCFLQYFTWTLPSESLWEVFRKAIFGLVMLIPFSLIYCWHRKSDSSKEWDAEAGISLGQWTHFWKSHFLFPEHKKSRENVLWRILHALPSLKTLQMTPHLNF